MMKTYSVTYLGYDGKEYTRKILANTMTEAGDKAWYMDENLMEILECIALPNMKYVVVYTRRDGTRGRMTVLDAKNSTEAGGKARIADSGLVMVDKVYWIPS